MFRVARICGIVARNEDRGRAYYFHITFEKILRCIEKSFEKTHENDKPRAFLFLEKTRKKRAIVSVAYKQPVDSDLSTRLITVVCTKRYRRPSLPLLLYASRFSTDRNFLDNANRDTKLVSIVVRIDVRSKVTNATGARNFQKKPTLVSCPFATIPKPFRARFLSLSWYDSTNTAHLLLVERAPFKKSDAYLARVTLDPLPGS